jgi:hypothetical protein
MKTLNVNNAAGTQVEINIESWSEEFVAYMLAYAHGVRMQRCTASADKADWTKVRQTMFDSMSAGEMPSSGGGRGPSMTVEEAGWVAYFNAKDTPVKFDKEKATKATLDKYLDALTRKAIWPGVAKFLAGKSKEEQITFHKEKLPALIAKHRPGMIATEEARTEDGSPGWYINAERVKRSGKIEKKVTEIEIEIEIE